MMEYLKYCFNTSNWHPTQEDYLFLFSTVPPEERNRINNFLFKKNAKQTLIGQLLIRYVISKHFKISCNEIKLERSTYGKPNLSTNDLFDEKIQFNISHSGDYAIIAALIFPKKYFDLNIGCDVMKVINSSQTYCSKNENFLVEFKKIENIIEKQFTERESAFIKSKQTYKDKLIAFYRIWCLKESYSKAIGMGLNFEFQNMEFVLNSDFDRENQFVTDTNLFIENKEICNCRFDEHYDEYDLHIMTICAIDNNQNQPNFKNKSRFVELYINDLKEIIIPLENIRLKKDFYEGFWLNFTKML